jgi:hypothetical protein
VIVRPLLLAGALAVAACGDGTRPASPALPAALQATGRTTLLRLPAAGGTATAYRATDLSALPWKVDKVPPVRRVVGADLDQGLVYAIDTSRGLFAIDLRARRVKPIQKRVRQAALGPDGSLYVVDSAGGITMLGRRRTTRLDATVGGEPGALVGTQSGHLLVLPSAKHAGLTVASPAEPAQELKAPAGQAVATLHGDLVAVAADGRVALLDPARPERARDLDVRGTARAVAFSPSGHRLYVAQDRDELLEYDRYGDDWRGGIELPGPARAIRADLFGTRLLVRPAQGDSVWVVDPALGRRVATVDADWGADLPLIAPPSLLVARRGADVVGVDLAGAAPDERGRLAGGARDVYLAVAWSPEQRDEAPAAETPARTPAPALAGDSAAAGTAAPAPGAPLYLQISSSRNADWARELAAKLAEAGVEATVLPPGGADDVYRVVAGPYASREQADSASRRLGMPSFVITLPGGAR